MPPRALAIAVCLIWLAPVPGCLFGGSSIDPGAFEIVVPDAAISTGGTPPLPGTGGVAAPPIGSGGVAVDSGGSGPGGASGGTPGGGLEAGTGAAPASGGTPAGSECAPPSAAVCDPVKNIGCLVPFTFCDIDPAQALKSGRCVFPASTVPPPVGTPPPPSPAAGASCEVTVLSTTCPPLHTCAGGNCRKLCNCDADCPTSECCSDEAPGPPRAFKLCGACP
jgi:hypothetical protein